MTYNVFDGTLNPTLLCHLISFCSFDALYSEAVC